MQQCIGSILLELDPLKVSPFAIGPTFLFQACIYPGPQQNRIEWLGQVIIRARFNAPDYGVGLLQAGDHDDRDPSPGIVRLDLGQEFDPVHVRHQNIQQDQIKFTLGQPLKRDDAGFREHHVMAVTAQAPQQQMAIAGNVIDDKDPPRLGLGSIRILVHSLLKIGGHAVGLGGGEVRDLHLLRPRKIHDRIDAIEQRFGFGEDDGNILAQHIMGRAGQLLSDHLGIADDRIERSPEVVSENGFGIGASKSHLLRPGIDQSIEKLVEIGGGAADLFEIGKQILEAEFACLLDDQFLIREDCPRGSAQMLGNVRRECAFLKFAVLGHGVAFFR